MKYPRIGDAVVCGDETYILTTEPCPIEDRCIDGAWYPSGFTASAYCIADEPDEFGRQPDYTIGFDLLDDADLSGDWEAMSDWVPQYADESDSLYCVEKDNWESK